MKEYSIHAVLGIFRTLFGIKSRLIGDMKKVVEGLDLNRTEVFALVHIHISHNIHMGKLCREIDLKSGSLTAVIDNLVQKGYACRKEDPRDRRKVLVTTTDKGKKAAEKICSHVEQTALAKIEKLSPKQQQDFFEALDVLNRISSSWGE